MKNCTSQLTHFLQNDLEIPADAIPQILQQYEQNPNRLPVLLWQRRLVTLAQLRDTLNWLDCHATSARGIDKKHPRWADADMQPVTV